MNRPASDQNDGQSRLLAVRGDELFRRLVNSVRDYAIFALAPDGTIATWNAGAQRIKGYSADEAIGRHFSMFYPAGAVARGWPSEELRRAALEGRFEDEGLRVRKDGSTFWANVVISPVLDGQGELIGFSKVTRDLTERREAERRLEESERNQRLLIETVRDHAMFLLDAGGLVRSWNAGCDRVFELSANDVVGKHVGALYTVADAARGAPRNELASAAAARVHRADGRRRRGMSSTFPAEVTTAALTSPEGALTGFVQVVRDLSHQDRAVALEAEGKRVNEFIAMLSHELRNPLAPIRNAVTLLQRSDTEATLKYATVINRQLAQLTRVVDDLLDVSQVSSGEKQMARQKVNMAEVIAAAVNATNHLAQSRHHRVQAKLPREELFVLGDIARLTQALVSLLNNAFQYTPTGGQITVSLWDGDGLATVKVTDTGVGMSDELLQHAFDPLVQGERELDRSDGGLGIGLTQVRNIVQLHGGTVAAASAGLGHGTTVTVTIPTSQEQVQGFEAISSETRSTGKSVLLVDDNVDAAEALAGCLELDGHEVKVVHDGPSAVEAVRNGFPDVVILDIGLPTINGYEVARRMRELPGGRNAYIVALSGYGQETDKEKSAAAGMDGHFVKPVDAEVVSSYVTTVQRRG